MSYVNIRDAAVYRVFGETARVRLPIMARRVQSLATDFANVDTGRLRSSFQTEFFWSPVFPSFTVRNTAPYALYVHEGTGAHRIEGNPLLIFTWRERGGILFTGPSVWHPGYRGNPYLRNAMAAVVGR